jgi:hypothetical protein
MEKEEIMAPSPSYYLAEIATLRLTFGNSYHHIQRSQLNAAILYFSSFKRTRMTQIRRITRIFL